MPDVDLVVMWVDGSDPLWLAEKNKYCAASPSESEAGYRFRDHGMMQYWFRSVERYLPWFRKIHFVTWGHLPPFLDTSNPKLHVVRHQDFMPEGTLPCFNSTALEINLFRIEGLAEHFVYFNDDMFVLRPMRKSDFFTEDGLPCQQFTETPPVFNGNMGTWQMHVVNDLSIINQHFQKKNCQHGRFRQYFSLKYPWYDNVRSLAMRFLYPNCFTGFKTAHIPQPFCKKTFETVWNAEPAYLKETSRHKFRDYRDVNQYLAAWWQLAEGNFAPRKTDAKTMIVNRDTIDNVHRCITERAVETVCINDGAFDPEYPAIRAKLADAFDSILPDKSSFEL